MSKAYANGRSTRRALDGVHLTVGPGERVGLVGASGAGKSTLARIMALLLRADSGHISLDGTIVRGWGFRVPARLRRQIQLTWQSPRTSADPRFTLKQILLEPLISMTPDERSLAQARLPELQHRVGLTADLLGRHPHAVSDGQLQRACLVRSLLTQPKYLICDEFTAMLDASTQATMLSAVAEEQNRTGMGVLLITHDHQLAAHWCDRVLELSHGRIAAVRAGASLRRA